MGSLELALDKELVLVVVLVLVLVWASGSVWVVLELEELESVLEARAWVLGWLSTPSDTHRLGHGYCTQS